MVDFRYASPENPQGVPVAPGHYDDVSRRTPDLRRPSARQGHFHPKRVLAFVLPRAGFFPPGWQQGDTSEEPVAEEPWRFRPRRRSGELPSKLPDAREHLFENKVFSGVDLLQVSAGRLVLRNCALEGGVVELSAGDQVHVIEDCIIQGTLIVKSGRVEIRRSAVAQLSVQVDASKTPAAIVEDSLLVHIQSAGLIKVLSSTVMEALQVGQCWASDSLFMGKVEANPGGGNYFRYCRLPAAALAAYVHKDEASQCVDDAPVFRSGTFGAPGAGVLLPASGLRLLDGAEDGGELGAYHHRQYFLREQAVITQVREALPVGLKVVLIPDERLVQERHEVSLSSF
jgi:hypothetical protein